MSTPGDCGRQRELLGQHGFQFKTRIGLPDGVGEIDVLAFHDKNPTELLVIEVKGVLEVDEVNEVDHATEELMSGQGQLRKVIGVLRALPPADRVRLWSKPTWPHVTDLYGVVLAPTAQPNARYDHREYPAITLDTLRTHFRPQHLRSPRRLWAAAVAKPWLRRFGGATFEFDQIRVGEVTYEIPAGVREEPLPTPPGRQGSAPSGLGRGTRRGRPR